jgi:hypothetical protein
MVMMMMMVEGKSKKTKDRHTSLQRVDQTAVVSTAVLTLHRHLI